MRRIAIKLLPGAFIVRSDNQNNNPTVIFVNPGSTTKVGGTKDRNTIGQAQALRPATMAIRRTANGTTNGAVQPGH